MTASEILILIGGMYLLLGSLTLSGVTASSGAIPSVKGTLLAFLGWPYYSYRGLRRLIGGL
jgi:hypothetical protein